MICHILESWNNVLYTTGTLFLPPRLDPGLLVCLETGVCRVQLVYKLEPEVHKRPLNRRMDNEFEWKCSRLVEGQKFSQEKEAWSQPWCSLMIIAASPAKVPAGHQERTPDVLHWEQKPGCWCMHIFLKGMYDCRARVNNRGWGCYSGKNSIIQNMLVLMKSQWKLMKSCLENLWGSKQCWAWALEMLLCLDQISAHFGNQNQRLANCVLVNAVRQQRRSCQSSHPCFLAASEGK